MSGSKSSNRMCAANEKRRGKYFSTIGGISSIPGALESIRELISLKISSVVTDVRNDEFGKLRGPKNLWCLHYYGFVHWLCGQGWKI